MHGPSTSRFDDCKRCGVYVGNPRYLVGNVSTGDSGYICARCFAVEAGTELSRFEERVIELALAELHARYRARFVAMLERAAGDARYWPAWMRAGVVV